MRLSKSVRSLFRVSARVALTASCLMVFSVVACAYTIVFRDGRRVEIPDDFFVANKTLTYEMAPGFNRTVQIALIDIPATERANREAPGTFMTHVEKAPAPPVPTSSSSGLSPARPRATTTLTNSDLVQIRQRRIESEKAYEKRRAELGLPSAEEQRWKEAQEDASTREWLRQRNQTASSKEAYWRDRASALREEIASTDAQINYLRARLSEFPNPQTSQPIITEVYPTIPNIGGIIIGGGTRDRMARRGTYRNGRPLPGYGYPNGYPGYGYPNGYPGYGYPNGYPGYGYPNGYPGYGYPNGYPGYGLPGAVSPEVSYERSALVERLNSLLVTRAGLSERWRALEDEARDARVPQIWLEPR